MTMIIVGKDCEDCTHCTTVDDTNRGRIKVYCDYSERWRWWGQSIPCENKTRRKDDEHLHQET